MVVIGWIARGICSLMECCCPPRSGDGVAFLNTRMINMRFRVTHLLMAMLVVALVLTRLSSHTAGDFLIQALYWAGISSTALEPLAGKRKAFLLAAWLCMGYFWVLAKLPGAEFSLMALVSGCLLGAYFASRARARGTTLA
jgi:hypothetical protein